MLFNIKTQGKDSDIARQKDELSVKFSETAPYLAEKKLFLIMLATAEVHITAKDHASQAFAAIRNNIEGATHHLRSLKRK
jgi:hypothetical protein